ncbi:uncharacterized protein LOC129726974 [Wyeomyia smithii]|uniref:uncharacterized protein LOC129726974 n=1 Tax=Wyeomyia smithii TaxID=174621 RepID=UPI0024680BE8|nr:uncharacterized protein LOC129726974 [Wyeomyia smithii]
MKVALVAFLLALGVVVQGSYHPLYPGYNPFAALQALGLYNPFVPLAPQVPFSGTYAYHDGIRPTVVQANNGGYRFPYGVPSPVRYSWHPWTAPVAAPVVPPAAVASYHYLGHAGYPLLPQKTVIQANLGSKSDPWKYGAFYGTGIYGVGFNNYIPVVRLS